MEKDVQSLVCPLCFTKALEKVGDHDGIDAQACLENLAEEGQRLLWVVRAGAAVHEDAIGADCRGQHLRAVSSRRAVEESDGKGRTISVGGGGRRTRERREEPVQPALGDGGGLSA